MRKGCRAAWPGYGGTGREQEGEMDEKEAAARITAAAERISQADLALLYRLAVRLSRA